MKKLKDVFKDRGSIILAIGIICLVFSFSNFIYANYKDYESNKYESNKVEETLEFTDSLEITSEELKKVSRDMDSNIGSGGDGGGNYEGAIGNSSITGTVRDEGVRVTLVDAETGKVITRPIDFANNPMPVTGWFGSVCKLSYLGVGNNKLSLTGQKLTSGGYNYVKPNSALPTIVNGNLSTIKAYFSDDNFLKDFSNRTKVSLENLKSGTYKIIIEPIGYPKINGVYYACTATELAMYDELLNGAIRKTLVDFSHKNLPLSMFLEKEDFGIYPFDTDYAYKRQTNETIISKLGIGILSAKPKEEENDEIIVPEYKYRVNTEVYTSLSSIYASDVLTGTSSKGYKVNPTQVTFSLSDSSDGAKIISTKGTAYKNDDTVYIRWKTPSVAKNMKVIAKIRYYGTVNEKTGALGYLTETVEIPIAIESFEENTPPNPVADDRNDSFRFTTPSNSLQKSNDTTTWKEYGLEIGMKFVYDADGFVKNILEVPLWTEKTHTATFEVGMRVYPDPLCKTYTYGNGRYTMKSGYGLRQELTGSVAIKTVIKEEFMNEDNFKESITRTEYNNTDLLIPAQNGVSFFSDFQYKNYFRKLVVNDTSVKNRNITSTLAFNNNRFSTYNNPTHFTPIWYPDNTYYTVFSYIFDCWTPAGMMYGYGWDSIEIDGNMWDDWYVQILPPDFDYYNNNPFE